LESLFGLYIISGDKNGNLKIWYVEDMKWIRNLKGHNKEISNIRAKRDKIVSSSLDATVRIWNFQTGCCIHVIQENTIFSSLAIKEDILVAASENERTRTWYCSDGTRVALNNGDCAVDISLKENRLISLSTDHFTLWNPYDYYVYQVVRPNEYKSDSDWNIEFKKVAYDGNSIVATISICNGIKIHLWDFIGSLKIPSAKSKTFYGSYTSRTLTSITSSRKFQFISFEELRWKHYQEKKESQDSEDSEEIEEDKETKKI